MFRDTADDLTSGHSFSRDASLLGIATKMLSFSGRPTEGNAASAINLIGLGTESATIRTDTEEPIEELRESGRGAKGFGEVR